MAVWKKIKGGYSELWKAIIRPPRENYKIGDLGPREFSILKRKFKRTDFQLMNKRGLILECSHFEPADNERVTEALPCVVFLHGNCSSRIEVLHYVPVLLPQNITVFALDLSGCGMSQGEYISLGWFERDDVDLVVEFLRNSQRTSAIGLWGRSMGAVTALMHGDRDHSIAGMVLDSPFSSLRILSEEIARTYSKIPKFIVSTAMNFVRKTILSKAGFDINDLVPINHVEKSFIPAFFVAATDDTFIHPHHAQDLHDKYMGDKTLKIIEGDHNSQRSQLLLDQISIFFYQTLQCEKLPQKENLSNMQFNLIDQEEEMLRIAIEESLKSQQREREELKQQFE